MGMLTELWSRWRGQATTANSSHLGPKLDKLVQTHAILELRAERSGEQYQSMMLGYNLDDGYIMLDEPFPNPSSPLKTGDLIQVTSRAKHLRLTFKARFIERLRIEGDAVIKLALPEAVQSPQNRKSFRVSTGLADNIRLETADIHGNRISCDVINISFEGIRFSLNGNRTENFSYGAVSRDSMLRLGDEATIRCTLHTRNMEYQRRPIYKTYIGAEMTDVSPRDRNLLTQYIAGLQRKQRRDASDHTEE